MRYVDRGVDTLDPEPETFCGECPIAPKTWERPYPMYRKDKQKWSLMMPAQTKHYEKAVRAWMKGEYGWAVPMSGALRFEAEFSSPRPTTRRVGEVYAPVKPDIDNFARSFLESIDFKSITAEGTRLGVVDQRQPIVAMSLSKRWSESDEWPGTRFSFSHDGAPGVLFSDYLYGAQTFETSDKPLIARASRRRFDDLGDAPEWHAQRLDFAPVPWKEPILYGDKMGTKSDVQTWQRRTRNAIASGYGMRKPMDGPLMLELEVVCSEMDKRYRNQWLLLVDYAKSLMDSFDYHAKTTDGHALGLIENDSRVVGLTASLRKTHDQEEPHMAFAVYPCLGKSDIGAMFDHIETGYIEW